MKCDLEYQPSPFPGSFASGRDCRDSFSMFIRHRSAGALIPWTTSMWRKTSNLSSRPYEHRAHLKPAIPCIRWWIFSYFCINLKSHQMNFNRINSNFENSLTFTPQHHSYLFYSAKSSPTTFNAYYQWINTSIIYRILMLIVTLYHKLIRITFIVVWQNTAESRRAMPAVK